MIYEPVEIRYLKSLLVSRLQVVISEGGFPGPDDDLGVVDVPADVQGELVQDLVNDLEEAFDLFDP